MDGADNVHCALPSCRGTLSNFYSCSEGKMVVTFAPDNFYCLKMFCMAVSSPYPAITERGLVVGLVKAHYKMISFAGEPAISL